MTLAGGNLFTPIKQTNERCPLTLGLDASLVGKDALLQLIFYYF